MRPTLEQRFWGKVDRRGPEECWPYRAGGAPGSYGHFWNQRDKVNGAHQTAYILSKGPIPDGLLVRHTCHNRRCCNPAHLKLGTHGDNMRDMTDAKRQARGERGAQARLTYQQVNEIFWFRRCGKSQEEIGARYGITATAVGMILNGKNWKHVPKPKLDREAAHKLVVARLYPRGERCGPSKLTEAQVREIRSLRAQGLGPTEIAPRFNITPSNVCRIAKRKSWAHVA